MIKLTFEIQNQIFNIFVNERELFYEDKNTRGRVRIIPQDSQLRRLVLLSRNRIQQSVFNLNEEEKKEYENCKNEEELAEFCIKDCIVKHKAKLINKEIL